MTFSGAHSGASLPILMLLTIFIFKYLTLNKETIASHFAEEKSKRLQDEINQKCSCRKIMPFLFLDKIIKRENSNLKKEKITVFKNWTNPKSHRKYYKFMEDIYHSRPPFQLCREVVVFPLFGSNSLDYEWRLASFRDPEFWCLDVSALELAEEGLKWEETEKILVCCQCCNSLTPDDIKRGESRHKLSCPFKRHRAQQSDFEDDHHVNYVRYSLRSGQPSDQNIFNWTADAHNPEDTIPGNDYVIFIRHPRPVTDVVDDHRVVYVRYILRSGHPYDQNIFNWTADAPNPEDSIPGNVYVISIVNPNTATEEPFIDVNPDRMHNPLYLRNSPYDLHISNPIGGTSTDLLSGSDILPGSNDETGLDEATGGAPPEE